MRGMAIVIPPTCDVTVPLLGAYQLAGFADSCGYPVVVYDLNIVFCKSIVNYATEYVQNAASFSSSDMPTDLNAAVAFIQSFSDLNGYDGLQYRFKSCDNYSSYWESVDYLRACYDLFSMQFDNLRFRVDGFDCEYRWNIWSDIERFISEYSEGILADTLSSLVKNIDFSSVDTVGISVTFESQLFISLLLCKIIRRLNPKLKIIIGGGFVNSFIDSPDSMGPISSCCDCVFAGEGEALIEFLSESSNDLSGVGVALQHDLARFVVPRDVCKKYVNVHPPRFPLETLNEYLSPKRIVPLRFSFDCYWGKCNFCADKEYHDCLEKEYRIEAMIDFCIREYSDKKIEGIYFLDSAISPRNVRLFASTLIQRGFSLPWGTNLRFEPAFDDENLIDVMVQSGFVFAKFGLESGSQHLLDQMNKGININIAANIIKKFRERGIYVHTYVMVAYPGETHEDRRLTEDFLLSDLSHPDNYSCSEFILYGNTNLADKYVDILKIGSDDDGWHSASYLFTNDEVKRFIVDLRGKYDAKYLPCSVLMSTGHTIAYSALLSNPPPENTSTRYVMLSKRVRYFTMYDVPYLVWWRRNRGCSYIQGDWAAYLHSTLVHGIPIEYFSHLGLSSQFTDTLWEESCITKSECGCDYLTLAPPPISTPQIIQHSKFDNLKWYGYYDTD